MIEKGYVNHVRKHLGTRQRKLKTRPIWVFIETCGWRWIRISWLAVSGCSLLPRVWSWSTTLGIILPTCLATWGVECLLSSLPTFSTSRTIGQYELSRRLARRGWRGSKQIVTSLMKTVMTDSPKLLINLYWADHKSSDAFFQMRLIKIHRI